MSYQPPKSAAELIQRYANGERIFSDVHLDSPNEEGNYPDFSGAHLENIVFQRSYLSASFQDANLKNAVFHWNVKCSNFNGADLRDASFSGTSIDATSFEGANLEGATFRGAFYHGHEFEEGELP